MSAESVQNPFTDEPTRATGADPGLDIPEAPRPLDPARVIKEAADARIAALETELAEAKDNWIRAAAETQNARRRAALDVEAAHKFAVEKFARDLLSVADNLSRALAALPPGGAGLDDKLKGVVAGVEATGRELGNILARHGVKRIEAQGAAFDPHLHQAVSEIPDATLPNNSVAQVFMDGYTLNDRLLRAAMVVVAKGGPAAAPAEPANAAVDADGG
ncbi:MAG: nucleotide exchange factor GrpE [Rhodospirillales bacterium]|nr:nucleotide exchange factor GrpE [Rhodospirillales bacterium]QQS10511.1 MAG: nucleotide exchange factor GrpE [Rhodospirillales bacterium]